MRIRLYLDVELVCPKKLHRSLLFYRMLQKRNRIGSGSGGFNYGEIVRELAEVFDVSEKTVQRAISAGEGKFWLVGMANKKRRIYLRGWRKVCVTFGVKPSENSIRMRLKFLKGSISGFRRVIYAMKVNRVIQRNGNSMTREQLAKSMKMSVDATRRMDKWVETVPCVEVLGRVKGPSIMPDLPNMFDTNAKTWPASDGGMLMVRQGRNLYRSTLSGFGGKFPRRIKRDYTIVPEYYGLGYVPSSIVPVDAIEIAFDEFSTDESEKPYTVLSSEVIVVPQWYLDQYRQ